MKMINKQPDERFLTRYAIKAAEKLGINPPRVRELMRAIGQNAPMPLILLSTDCQLWIDRYYIAYHRFYERDVHYVYLSQYHMDEECNAALLAHKLRGTPINLPSDVLEEFKKAKAVMIETGVSYYLDKQFFEIG